MLSEGGNMRTLFFLIISEVLLLDLICTSRVRVRRQTMKVRITATGDTIILKFLRPEADTKLEGYILGYGSGMFSKQFIKLPEENEHYETEIDAEPKYLIVVQPVKANKVKKKCTGKVSLEKPLHLMIGTVTPTSVHLSWGTLLKTPYTDAHLEDCEEDGEFTVRYKEKETSHKWNYETCPTTDTVIDNLKPDTPYEFEVRAETKADTGAWSPPVTHNTADIHEPLKPRSQLSPQKPTVDDPRAFPPVTIRHNITLSRHPPLVRHTADPPTPRGNQGQVISRNSPSPHLLARPLGPKVVQNGTRLAKWVSHNSSSPELVTHPLDPTVVHTLSSALVVNGTHPAKWNASNSISPVLVADPLGPKVARNGTRPVKGNTSNSSTPVLVADPLGPKVARNGTRPVKGNTRNSSTPVLVADPLGPKVAWNGTRPVKGNTRNSSTPVLVADPLGPKVAWNGTRPVKGNTRNSSTSILVADLLGPKVARNGTRPVKGNTRNSSTPVLVADPLGPKVARNGTRPVKGNTRNSSTPVLVADPLGPKVVQNGTPSGRGPPGSTRNTKTKVPSGVKHQKRSQLKPTNRPRKQFESFANLRAPVSNKKTPNQAEQPTEKDKITDLKQMEKLPVLKPQPAPSTEKIVYRKPTPTSTPLSRFNGSWFGTGPNSTIFRAVPVSDVDAMGKQRFTAPHVIYNTGKRPEEPCSVTRSLGLFPDEENEEVNVTGPPKTPPSNVTVVTVEGCPSFVIIDWQKTDNETTAYEILTKGPNGNNIAVVTNQTHTAVENLKPQSNYEFTVTPKNELGVGPPTEPVSFSTESADPRISDVPTGKTAIWSSFPFKADSYSECNGRQFVKRTWYRKFVGIQLCNSLRYKIYLSDSLKGRFYTIGDQTGYGEDHCQFVDSYLDGRTGGPLQPNQLPAREGYFRSMRQEPVKFGKIGGTSYINYVAWYECGVPIPGSW
ncbi:fibronectin type III domain-containing protein 1 isoform X3 [Electrophorus electricus]|uniref:fibronectin type III domain-containing protein 1 isoform X3 n=1 Tax=Electrophorus electricus TaxID=8005 RepID=UPI0015CF88E1|nr:fibronectin type III domain-containing protein 1 isoform X3 [Electrophorus electricus]